MKIFQLLLLIVLFLATKGDFNINCTTAIDLVAWEASLLVGIPSSFYPNEAFLNFLLYGDTYPRFSYEDFYKTLGKRTGWVPGSVIIGQDMEFGGIVSTALTFIAPIP